MKRLLALVLVLVLCLSMMVGCSDSKDTAEPAPAPAEAENAEAEVPQTAWPERPVTILVPYGAGGDSDFNARLLAEKLTEKFGQSFVVQNVSGNSGATGSLQALSADPDGYTILFNHTNFLINYFVDASELTYDDVTFGAIVAQLPLETSQFCCSPELGFTKMSEIKAYSEEHPGELLFGAATGSTLLVTGLRLLSNGFDVTLVDAGGTADRLTAILGGHVDFTTNAKKTVEDYEKTGELVKLENDIGPELICPTIYTMLFPKGTDTAIVDKLNEALGDIIANDTDYAQRIADAYDQTPFFKPGEEGEAQMREMWDEFSTWDWTL